MQGVRRSNRIRNRISNVGTPRNARGNMGGDEDNVVNNGNMGPAQINFDIGDLVPNEQGQGDHQDELDVFNADFFIRQENAITSFFTNFFLKGFAVVLIITLTFFLSNLFTSMIITENYQPLQTATNSILSRNKYNFDSNYKCPSKYNIVKQTNVDKSIRHLKRELRKLNKGIDEFARWRGNMTAETRIIKQDFILELEKFNTKIEKALTLYDADKVGMRDYALESAGGFITSIPETIPFPSHLSYAIMGLININYPSNPRLLIQPGTLPGQCFAFKGHLGRIRIELAHVVNITAVTIEHAHQDLVGDMNSAPKDFKVYGLERADSETRDELGAFTYSLDNKPLQTYYVQETSNQKGYKHVELHILTNQGNLEYTCVYRFRVHGDRIVSSD